MLKRAPLALLTPLLAAVAANATELNRVALSRYGTNEQVTSIGQFSDVRPGDWAYQALSNLIERNGCVAGYSNGRIVGNRTISRFEAAALLNACLDRLSTVTDELKQLMAAFAPELTALKGRLDGAEAKVGVMAAQQFSSTTKLSGQATMVLGGSAYSGSAINTAANTVNTATQGDQTLPNALSFNYDVRLTFDSSFNGSDLLRTQLRAGNFDGNNNSFGGGGPTPLSTLETAFQEPRGAQILGIYKLYYQAPLGGGLTATVGPRVAMEDILAFWPSVYPASTVLDVLTMAGAPVAYNYNRGAGAGLWWQRNGWSLSANYVAGNGNDGNPAAGGIGTANAASSGTVQFGFHDPSWGLALAYTGVQNGAIPYGTLSLLDALNTGPTFTNAFALSGYWQPSRSGWIPSISAGWGINSTTYNTLQPPGTATTIQSWSVGLNWNDAFAPGHAAGMGFGQAPFATAQSGGGNPNDANWMWEWWYNLQLSDNISVTPAVFYLSRPLGQQTPAGQSFNQWGALIKTQFTF